MAIDNAQAESGSRAFHIDQPFLVSSMTYGGPQLVGACAIYEPYIVAASDVLPMKT